jgi:hypothetical protein
LQYKFSCKEINNQNRQFCKYGEKWLGNNAFVTGGFGRLRRCVKVLAERSNFAASP